MANNMISILIALLLQPGTMIKGFPCSDSYTLRNKSGSTEIIGQIEIPSPSNNSRYHLKVGFNMNCSLHKEKPRLDVAESEQEILQSVEQDRPLVYQIYFSMNQSIPILTKISFNDKVLYSQETSSNQTSNEVERIVYSPGAESFSITDLQPDNSSLSTIQDSSPVPSFSQWNNSTPILNPFQPQDPLLAAMSINSTECGISNVIHNNRVRRIVNGTLVFHKERVRRGEWPWLAAIYVANRIDSIQFQCGGSVLTTKHVITAAHCLKINGFGNDTFPPTVIFVSVGRFNLNRWHERDSLNREVASYTIHPDFAHYLSADSDLAILTLRTPIQYGPFIRPICLWPDNSTDVQHIVSKTGYVVGWGPDDETGQTYTENPWMVRMPIVSQETCLRSDQSYFDLTSTRTFCAGAGEDVPCIGPYDGNGLVIFDNTTRRYHLRGIVSRTKPNVNFWCNGNYVVYVDVAKYIRWIQQQIST